MYGASSGRRAVGAGTGCMKGSVGSGALHSQSGVETRGSSDIVHSVCEPHPLGVVHWGRVVRKSGGVGQVGESRVRSRKSMMPGLLEPMSRVVVSPGVQLPRKVSWAAVMSCGRLAQTSRPKWGDEAIEATRVTLKRAIGLPVSAPAPPPTPAVAPVASQLSVIESYRVRVAALMVPMPPPHAVVPRPMTRVRRKLEVPTVAVPPAFIPSLRSCRCWGRGVHTRRSVKVDKWKNGDDNLRFY